MLQPRRLAYQTPNLKAQKLAKAEIARAYGEDADGNARQPEPRPTP